MRWLQRKTDCLVSEQTVQTDTVFTLILLVAFSAWDRRQDLIPDARSWHALLAQWLRKKRPSCLLQNTEQGSWSAFVMQESYRRAVLVGYAYLSVQCILFDVPPSVLSHEVDAILPCSTAQWQAGTESLWESLSEHHEINPPSLVEGMRLLSTSHGIEDHNMRTMLGSSCLGNFILLQSLIQRIFHARQLQTFSSSSLRDCDLVEIE